MSNMKIISMLGHDSKRIRADNEADIATVLAVVEEELAPLQDQIERLRADMNKLMEARDGTVLSVTHRKRSSRGVDRVRLSKQGLEGFKKQNRWISAGWSKRGGTVCSFTKRHEAYALWDGGRSTEIVPIAILETVQRSPSSSE